MRIVVRYGIMRYTAKFIVVLFTLVTVFGQCLAMPMKYHAHGADDALLIGSDTSDHHHHSVDRDRADNDHSAPSVDVSAASHLCKPEACDAGDVPKDVGGHFHVTCCTTAFALPSDIITFQSPALVDVPLAAIATSSAPGKILYELLRPPRSAA